MQTTTELFAKLLELGSQYTPAETTVANYFVERNATFDISKSQNINTRATYAIDHKGKKYTLTVWFRVHVHQFDNRPTHIAISLSQFYCEGMRREDGPRSGTRARFELTVEEANWDQIPDLLNEKITDWEKYVVRAANIAVSDYAKTVAVHGTDEEQKAKRASEMAELDRKRLLNNEAVKQRIIEKNGLARHPKRQIIIEVAISLQNYDTHYLQNSEKYINRIVRKLKLIM